MHTLSPESLERGSEYLNFLETTFPDSSPSDIAVLAGLSVYGGMTDRLFIPQLRSLRHAAKFAVEHFGIYPPQLNGAADPREEWSYLIMARAGAEPSHALLVELFKSLVRFDRGIDSEGIKKTFAERTNAFWYSIGGEILQCYLRGFARPVELRAAVLSLEQVPSHLHDQTPLSVLYEESRRHIANNPRPEERELFELSCALVRPNYLPQLAGWLGIQLPILEKRGIIPASRSHLEDPQAVTIEWPPQHIETALLDEALIA